MSQGQQTEPTALDNHLEELRSIISGQYLSGLNDFELQNRYAQPNPYLDGANILDGTIPSGALASDALGEQNHGSLKDLLFLDDQTGLVRQQKAGSGSTASTINLGVAVWLILDDWNNLASPTTPLLDLSGLRIELIGGTGSGQKRVIGAQTATDTVLVGADWLTIPDNTTTYRIFPPKADDHGQYLHVDLDSDVLGNNQHYGDEAFNTGLALPDIAGTTDTPPYAGAIKVDTAASKTYVSYDGSTWTEIGAGGTGPVGRFGTKLASEWINVNPTGGWASFLFCQPAADSTANGWHYQEGTSTNSLKNWRFDGAAASDMLADTTYYIKETKLGGDPFTLKVEIFSDSAKTILIATGTTGVTPEAEDLALVNGASQTVCTVEVGSATSTVTNSILYKGGVNVAVTVYGQDDADSKITLSQTRHFSFHRNWKFIYSLGPEFPILGIGAGKTIKGNAVIQSVWASPLDKFYGTMAMQDSGGNGFTFPLAVLEA